MKKLSNLLAALVFVSLVIFMGCGSDSGGSDPVDPLDAQAALMGGSWTTTASNVTYNGSPATDGDWSGFTLTISGATAAGGSYQAGGVPTNFEDVWPSSGTWEFANTSGTQITRAASGNVGAEDITIVVSATSLELTFDNTGALGRTAGIEGSWKFTMSK